LLEVNNLVKKFGTNVALNNVSFVTDKPEVIGVIGRSGAGKSTLLRTINRLNRATSGEVLVDGVDVLKLRGDEKLRWQKDCAMIFQQFNLVNRLDVITNVILGSLNTQPSLKAMLKLFSDEDRSTALRLLDRFGMIDTALQRAETLSGGQQQRVAICRAMMQQPKFILADEPIASLDPLNARLVMDALHRINREENILVICNLHTLDTARNYCDRVIGMRMGEIVFDGPSSELTDEMAREIYGAEADEAFEPGVTSTALGETPIAAGA
tara:strand:+ start:109 stop:912 length:804 start_codon:yes stop_codon:yes gene_type:complete